LPGTGHQPPQIVTHNALEGHLNAELVELLRKVKRIGICVEGSEKLGAYRDDLGIHAKKFK
jgi:hypothetical protein